MKRVFTIVAILLFVLGISAVIGAKLLSNANSAYDFLLFFGGVMLGSVAVFVTLIWVSGRNPAIATEIEKLDRR